jgi:phosphoglycerate dehydrogenase-like enzyme
MRSLPVVLIHSGRHLDDIEVGRQVAEVYPDMHILTPATDEEVAEHLPGAEVLFAFYFPYHLLPLATSLRWFQVMGAGLEKLAAAADTLPPGVQVTNLKNVFGGAMAEYAMAYILAHAQDVRGVLRAQSEHHWRDFTPARIAGATLGVIGLGSIGREVAKYGNALGMRVIGVKREQGAVDGVERVFTVDEIDEFLPLCDYLVCVVPQTARTIGLLSRERLRLLKPTCFLVNMGRGTLADPDDLAEGLAAGWFAGAALDVFPVEPLPPEHPLWSHDNAFITPHISGVNRPDDVVRVFLDNMDRYLAGQPLLYTVDLKRGY